MDLLVLLGPTASGKTRVGVALAKALGGEIISADSRQVFRGLDIGTGKDLHEYGEVPFHLIDVVEPGEPFSLFHFQRHFAAVFQDIRKRGHLPILVGGTGLYLSSVLLGYRMAEVPENPFLRAELGHLSHGELVARLMALKGRLHNQTDLDDRERLLRAIEIAQAGEADALALSVNPGVYGLRWERERLRGRIDARLRERLAGGLVDEVRGLLAAGMDGQEMERLGLEYRFVGRHVQGLINRNDLFQQLRSAIHQYAKRQETWFRGMVRKGVCIHWVAGDGDAVGEILSHWRSLGNKPPVTPPILPATPSPSSP